MSARSSVLTEYPTRERLAGDDELLPSKAFPVELHGSDIFLQCCGGGSGLGDALLRDPGRVAQDVADGYVSLDQAEHAYGVIVDVATGATDIPKTERARSRIRSERLGREVRPNTPSEVRSGEPGRRVSRYLEEVGANGQRKIACTCCGIEVADAGTAWRDAVPSRESDLAEHLAKRRVWVQRRDDEPLRFVERFCPGCATLLETEIVRPTARASSVGA